jgi:hypothetical protein
MSELDNNEQTAATIVGFPRGEEGVAATDGLSEVVEAITNKIEKAATGEVDSEKMKEKTSSRNE